MIAYFPAIYPDELVYSWFCRFYAHSGYFTHKAAMQDLYCKRSDTPSKEFIGNLNPEVRALIGDLYPMESLVLDHTMYPQYARFIPAEAKSSAFQRLEHDSCDVHHLFAVLPRAEGEQYLRYCPLCAQEDRNQYGETYWHRKHQIRNMGVCTKHHCKLMESSIPAKSEQCFTFCPAERHIPYDSPIPAENQSVIRFAEYLEAVFDVQVDFDSDIPISSVLYDGMSRTKYLKPSGRSRYTKLLADDIQKFYGGLGLYSIASMSQIQRVLLGSRYDFSVVCQIAFFLGMSPEELTQPSLSPEQVQQEQDTHYMKDAQPVDWEQLDKETAPVLERLLRSVYYGTENDSGRPERVSERLVYREMNLLGHQLENMPMCKAIFEKYTEAYPESWARKIIWAYRKLEEIGAPFYWSDIRRISGVKKENFPSIVPYLTKHTDADSVASILALTDL